MIRDQLEKNELKKRSMDLRAAWLKLKRARLEEDKKTRREEKEQCKLNMPFKLAMDQSMKSTIEVMRTNLIHPAHEDEEG